MRDRRRRLLVPIALLFALCAIGCPSAPESDTPGHRDQAETAPLVSTRASDTAVSPGIESARGPLTFRMQLLPFQYERGESGAAWPVEVTGGGVALIDIDNDGDLDIFFAQGQKLPVGTDPNPPADVLLLNDGNKQFVNVSQQYGLTAKGYGQGVQAADYDADGDIDVYVTRYGKNTLWRNEGGRFTDVTAESGVDCANWSLGAAFFDYDNDGDLDLFVANYLDFDPAQAPFERTKDGRAEYGAPAKFVGLPDTLYRNDGNGRFTDVTAEAGLGQAWRGMGCLAADLGGHCALDIVVANDAQANTVWFTNGDGHYVDLAAVIGLDVNGQGNAEANMGIARGDVDGDLTQDVIMTHFVNEHDTLWRGIKLPMGGVLFIDATYEAGLGVDSMPFTGWGTALADFDHDGWLDLVITNGHIRVETVQKYAVANPPLLWRNKGKGRFQNVTKTAGPYFQGLYQGRGLAVGDLDNDGDLDIVIVHHKMPSVVLWNESPKQGHWIILDLKGAGSNRDAIGAQILVNAGGQSYVRSIDGGGGYLSVNDRRVHLGLGHAERVERVTVQWPSRLVETRSDLPVDTVVKWREGETP